MVEYQVTRSTMDAIRARTAPGHTFRPAGRRLPNGDWSIPVEDDTADRIEGHRLLGETDDDVISRLLAGEAH